MTEPVCTQWIVYRLDGSRFEYFEQGMPRISIGDGHQIKGVLVEVLYHVMTPTIADTPHRVGQVYGVAEREPGRAH